MDKTLTLMLVHACKLVAFVGVIAVLWGQGQLGLGLAAAIFFWGTVGLSVYRHLPLEPFVSTAGLFAFAALAAIEKAPPLALLPFVVSALMGWEFSRFYAHCHRVDALESQVLVQHRNRVFVTGLVALFVGLLGGLVQLQLGFWPVLGVAVLTLFILAHLVGRPA